MRGKNKSKQKKGRREAKLMGRNREAEGRRGQAGSHGTVADSNRAGLLCSSD